MTESDELFAGYVNARVQNAIRQGTGLDVSSFASYDAGEVSGMLAAVIRIGSDEPRRELTPAMSRWDREMHERRTGDGN